MSTSAPIHSPPWTGIGGGSSRAGCPHPIERTKAWGKEGARRSIVFPRHRLVDEEGGPSVSVTCDMDDRTESETVRTKHAMYASETSS
eukprot:scaffold113_cov339-Pavlova_lutheri.AAC.39